MGSQARVLLPLCYLPRDLCVVFAHLTLGDGPLTCHTEVTAQTAEKPVQSGSQSPESPAGALLTRRALLTGMSQPEVTNMGSFEECHRNVAALAFYSRFPQLLHMASYRNDYWRNIYNFFKCIPRHEKEIITWEHPFPQKHGSKYIKQMLKMAL